MNTNRCIVDISGELECSNSTAEEILRAVMQALRDGVDVDEAAKIESSLPADLRPMWPLRAGAHFGLADLGDVGFLGRVREYAASSSDDETKQMVHAVMTALMTAISIPGGERDAPWQALSRLPRERKVLWMKLFRAACYPVELLAAQRPLKTGRRFSRKARTPSR